MLFLSLFSWWYGAGWRDQSSLFISRLSRLSDRFSVSLLLRSFFSPFRQISAGTVGGSLDARLRALVDKLISRCIGAMIRSTLIFTAILLLIFETFLGALRLLLWPIVPFVPLVGFFFMISGWVPWHL